MAKTIRLASPLQTDSIVDGEGIRSVVWTQGCSHNCKGCHNPETHDFKNGYDLEITEIIDEIDKLEGQNGITFSGGDPMMQPEGFTELACAIKEQSHKTIWCYTGYTYETLLTMPAQRELLRHIDVLVDGPFIQDLRDEQLRFRGSSNQRTIDVQRSLESGTVILWTD